MKMEYSVFATNGMGVPGARARSPTGPTSAAWSTAPRTSTTPWPTAGESGSGFPARASTSASRSIVNAPYSHADGAVISVWQPYFNYHRGNWDFRFEYGNNYERTRPFIGNNIDRNGFYAQVAYRNYESIHKHLQRLEYVFRFSDACFHGIDQAAVAANAISFDRPWTHRSTATSTRSGSTTTSMPQRSSRSPTRSIPSFIEIARQCLLMQFATNF